MNVYNRLTAVVSTGARASLLWIMGCVGVAGCAGEGPESALLAEEQEGAAEVVPLSSGGATEIPDQYEPIGYLDAISNTGMATGWACDKDAPLVSIQVHFWSASWSTYFGSVVANRGSESAVNTQCGGGTAHRFAFQLPTAASTVPLNAFGIDVTSGSGLLIGSPKTFTYTQMVVLYPTDDSWSDEANPMAVHGAETEIHLRAASPGVGRQHGYLRYDLSGIPGTIQEALFYVYIGTVPIPSLGIYRIDDTDWTEETLNWNNASMAPLGSQVYNNLAAQSFRTLDVTDQVLLSPVVSDPDVVTLGLGQSGTTSAFIYSKEFSVVPRLGVTYTIP